MRTRKSRFKHLFLLSTLLLGLALSGMLAPTAEAAVAGCRSDPLVVLSDGTILDVTTDIATTVANVTEIHYTVHGPRGVKLVAAIRTPTLGFLGKETFTYYADGAPNQYVTEALVRTKINNVAVTAHSTFVNVSASSGILVSLQYNPVYGFNNQTLRVVLNR